MNINELYHHGIQGQRWGVRRYQYEDGTRTPEGKKRYSAGGLLRNDIADRVSSKANRIRQEGIMKTIPYDQRIDANKAKIRTIETQRDAATFRTSFQAQRSSDAAQRLRDSKYENPDNIGKKIVNKLLDGQIKTYEGNVNQWGEYEDVIKKFYGHSIKSYNKANSKLEKRKQDTIDMYERSAQRVDNIANKIRGH